MHLTLARFLNSRWFRPPVFLLAALILLAMPAVGQEEPATPQPLTEELRKELEGLRAQVGGQRQTVTAFEERLPAADGHIRDMLLLRIERERLELLQDGLRFAGAVRDQRDAGYVVDDFEATAVEVLRSHGDIFLQSWEGTDGRASELVLSESAAAQAAADRVFFDIQGNKDRMIALTADSFSLLADLGVESSGAIATFENRLQERVLQASLIVDIALEKAEEVRAARSALPNDADLAAELTVAESRVQRATESLERVVSELDELGNDVSEYRQQLLTATGTIAAADLDVSVLRSLLEDWGEAAMTQVSEEGPGFLFNALLVAVIVFVFYKVSRLARRVAEGALSRSDAAVSVLLKRMIASAIANLILAVGVLLALSQLGFSLGPILAGLGIAGFVLGFALQDSLSNFASGLLILFNRPYDVGDIVEVGGVLGKVEKMSLVNTTVLTLDNQRVILPNTMIWSNVIKNVTAQDMRRVDLVFGISYSDDILKAEEVLRDIVASHELVLDDPAPVVRLHELGDSSVNFVVRPWARPEDYWDVYWDITRAVKLRFDEENISIPFPQRDVHVVQHMPAGAAAD